jgi:hypothetical protein
MVIGPRPFRLKGELYVVFLLASRHAVVKYQVSEKENENE